MRRASDESLTNVGNEWTMSVRMESRNVDICEDGHETADTMGLPGLNGL